MDQNKSQVRSQITFLYYRDLQPVSEFYEGIMGFDLIEDQGWAKIYRVNGNAHLGIVNEEKGFHKAQQKNAVLITFVVDDVSWWYDYLRGRGVKMLTGLREVADIQVRCFFLEDPGQYTIEVQQFLKPEIARVFHQAD